MLKLRIFFFLGDSFEINFEYRAALGRLFYVYAPFISFGNSLQSFCIPSIQEHYKFRVKCLSYPIHEKTKLKGKHI